MKRLIAFVLVFVCLMSLAGCNVQQTTSPEYVTEENGKEYLILPVSKSKVRVREEHKQYLDSIDIDMLRTAEEMISVQILEGEDRSAFYLEIIDGQLYLGVEVIADIDPPKTQTTEDGNVIDKGCGIDHEHLFLKEPITKSAA